MNPITVGQDFVRKSTLSCLSSESGTRFGGEKKKINIDFVLFSGRLCVPLLSVKNSDKKWWALKDKTLRTRAKGTFPQIQLEFELVWSPLMATYVTLNPKKEIHMKTVDKFKRQVFVNNVMRIKEVILSILDFVGFIKSCLEWEDVPRSVVAFIIFMTVTYYFEPYMAPIGLLLFFLKHYIVTR